MADDTTPDVQARAVEVLAESIARNHERRYVERNDIEVQMEANDAAAALHSAGLLRTPGGPWDQQQGECQATPTTFHEWRFMCVGCGLEDHDDGPIPAEDRKDTTP